MNYRSRMVIGVAGLVGGLASTPFGAVLAKDAESGRPTVSVKADEALLDFFDVACAEFKNFESLKAATARKKWRLITLKSVDHMNRAVKLLTIRRSEIQRIEAYEYSAEIRGTNVFIHIERVEYKDGKYANRCSLHETTIDASFTTAQLRKWRGRDADRVLDRSPMALSAEWLQLPNGAPRIIVYYRKPLGQDQNSPVPGGTHIQIEFSGLRQKV